MPSRSILLGVCVLLVATSLVLPSAAQPIKDNVGFVRFVHTAIDQGPIDIYVGANPKPVATNLKYGDVTDFVTLPVTTSGYVARAAGSPADSKPLFSLNWGLRTNESQMITAAGLNSRKAFLMEPIILVRNKTNGKARVRIFDTVWGGSNLNVSATQGLNFSTNQHYLSVSDSADIAPGAYDFQVKDGSGKVVGSLSGATLEADKVYMLLIVGGTTGTPPITLLPVMSDEEKTRVQFVNQTGSAVDVYIKGETKPFAANLGANATTDLMALPTGSVTFVVRKAGSSVTDKELAYIATQLYPGRDLVITVGASGGLVQMAITSYALTPPIAATAQATLMATAPPTASATMQSTSAATAAP